MLSNLLYLEYLKFRKNSVVKMLLWIYLLAFPLLIFIGKEDSLTKGTPINKNVFYKFPTVWDWLGYEGNWLVFFCLGFLIVYMISIEKTYKTQRQTIINGMTKQQYLLSKYLIVIVFSLCATVLYAFVGFIIGWIHTEGATLSTALDNNWAIARYFLMCLGYLSFAYFCGFLIKNSGLAVLLYLSYGLLLETMIRWLGHKNIIDGPSMYYYPINATSDLFPNPFYKIGEAMTGGGIGSNLLSASHASITTFVYILFFLAITYYLFMKKDI